SPRPCPRGGLRGLAGLRGSPTGHGPGRVRPSGTAGPRRARRTAGLAPEVEALRDLVKGPTRAERATGLRSALREGVHLQSVRAEGDVWLARFSRSLLAPATTSTMERRFAQIGATLAPLGPERYAA